MSNDRDVAAFDERAPTYERGWLGRMHHEIADRVATLAVATVPSAVRVLDVGCGTGYLLRQLAGALPAAEALQGIDAAAGMIQVAQSVAADPRIRFDTGVAEQLPNDDGTFDLLVSTTSFDHWQDQRAGLASCYRVLRPGGALVLCDQFSAWLRITLVSDRRGKARTQRRATTLLQETGFTSLQWQPVYTPLIRAVTAIKK